MKAPKTALGLFAALALALPAGSAAAEETAAVVPPENSAATQYTEAVPTAGGDSTSGGGHEKPSPAKVLGSKNAHKLESQGSEGREVARVVAETAPETSAPAATARPAEAQRAGNGPDGNGQGNADGSGGNSQGQAHRRQVEPAAEKPSTAPTELPSGSSALGEIVAEATGSSSSGQLGALLPLATLAAIAWSLAFLWRQRRTVD
jgi:hypothetical protein